MSFIDSIVDAVKHADLSSVQKAASSAYHSAASSASGLGNSAESTAKSAYHSAAAGAKSVEETALEALHNAGDLFERTRTHGEPDYVKGFVAGMIGGLVGTGIKMIIDRSLPTAQPQEEHAARIQVIEGAKEVVDTDMDRNQEEIAQQALNIGFGAIVGGIYGVIVEAAPAVQAPAGVSFGAALWTAAHKIALPALGLTPKPLDDDLSLQAGQLGSHMAYGATVEIVRRGVRHVMDEEDVL
jgi:uncharacterized membrane protein YagU involved in acid resistance